VGHRTWPAGGQLRATTGFFFNAHSDFFEEIAKFRAARTIWGEVMRDRFWAPGTSEAEASHTRAKRPVARSRGSSRTTTIVRTALQGLCRSAWRDAIAAYELAR